MTPMLYVRLKINKINEFRTSLHAHRRRRATFFFFFFSRVREFKLIQFFNDIVFNILCVYVCYKAYVSCGFCIFFLPLNQSRRAL